MEIFEYKNDHFPEKYVTPKLDKQTDKVVDKN